MTMRDDCARTARHYLVSIAVCVALIFLCTAEPAAGQDCNACCPTSYWGDGSHGDLVISTDTTLILDTDKYYHDVTVNSGITLTLVSKGNVVHVCGTLTNLGTITESATHPDSLGGASGTGGAIGLGANPKGDSEPPGCPPRQTTCTAGGAGGPGGTSSSMTRTAATAARAARAARAAATCSSACTSSTTST
jgi:hypothetical protein